MVRKVSQAGGDAITPTRYAEGPPPAQENGALPLMAVMEIQRTLGSLTQAVEHLKEAHRQTDAKVNEVAQKVHTAQTIVWVVGAGLMAIIGLAGWVISNALQVLPDLINAPK